MLGNQNHQTSSIKYLKKLVLAWGYLIRSTERDMSVTGEIFLLL